MKKAFCTTFLTITLLLASTAAFAAFTQTVTPDANNSGYQFVEVNWTHTYDGSVPGPVKATLGIWADDVDSAAYGRDAEVDKVFLNGTYLGDLLTYGDFDDNRPDGTPQNLSYTEFDITPFLAAVMDLRIEVFRGASSYAMELIDSTLTVSSTPLPGALWLLGTGLFGMVGIRKKLIG